MTEAEVGKDVVVLTITVGAGEVRAHIQPEPDKDMSEIFLRKIPDQWTRTAHSGIYTIGYDPHDQAGTGEGSVNLSIGIPCDGARASVDALVGYIGRTLVMMGNSLRFLFDKFPAVSDFEEVYQDVFGHAVETAFEKEFVELVTPQSVPFIITHNDDMQSRCDEVMTNAEILGVSAFAIPSPDQNSFYTHVREVMVSRANEAMANVQQRMITARMRSLAHVKGFLSGEEREKVERAYEHLGDAFAITLEEVIPQWGAQNPIEA